MRPGTDTSILAALEAAGITTCILGSLEFKSETVNVWTGAHPLTVQGSTDTLLDGKTFEPMVHGVVLNIGDNAFSMSGSEALDISLAIPSAPSRAIAAATVYPDEYQGRLATLWRAIMIVPPGAGTPPTWAFRRIRSGSMDQVKVSNDGISHTFTLSIEGHASLISNASNSTYMDQKRFDAADTSQDYAASCANGDPAPSKSGVTGLARAGEIIRQQQDAGWSFR